MKLLVMLNAHFQAGFTDALHWQEPEIDIETLVSREELLWSRGAQNLWSLDFENCNVSYVKLHVPDYGMKTDRHLLLKTKHTQQTLIHKVENTIAIVI